MSILKRLEIGLPLIGLTLGLLVAAVGGTWTTWDDRTTYERVAFVAASAVMALACAVSVSIVVRPHDDFPWGRVFLAVGGMVLSCALLAMADAVAQSSVH